MGTWHAAGKGMGGHFLEVHSSLGLDWEIFQTEAMFKVQ